MNSQINMISTFNKNKQPFIAPEGYFEKLADNILYQINELPASKTKITPFFVFKRQLLAVAAFFGFFLLSYGIYKVITYSLSDYKNQLVNKSLYEEVLLAKTNEYEIVNVLLEDDKQQFVIPEAIENYLIDEKINDQIIINENIKP